MIYILLPAYNEYPNLIKILEQISNETFLKGKTTVILVNDGSTDETKKLENYENNNFIFKYIINEINLGLSPTLEKGLNYIVSNSNDDDIIITLDSDNTHPIKYIHNMVEKLNDSDVVIASRFVSGSRVLGLSIFRKTLSFFAKILFSLFLPIKNVKDYTCNFRAYKAIHLKNLIITKKDLFVSKDFGIAAEILIQLYLINNNLRFNEIPFTLHYNQKIGVSKIKVLKTIFLTIKIILKNFILKIFKK